MKIDLKMMHSSAHACVTEQDKLIIVNIHACFACKMQGFQGNLDGPVLG